MVGTTISHYAILERLGGGGIGVVYRAEDTRLKRLVALKFLSPALTLDPEARERFSREAQAASSLQHRNICTVHDIEQTPDGQMFIVMDLYEGRTLKRRMEEGDLSLEEILAISAQIADGLGEAHRHGLVHRDIKPGNIILTERNEVKILDFGLAKLSCQQGLTLTGTTLGTVAYMSPEQARGEEVDQRTDIWSFGVILYEMLAGAPPFAGEHPMSLIYSILNEEPKDIALARPDLPFDLTSLCRNCLQKERDRRPPSMDSVLPVLEKTPRKGHAVPRILQQIPPLVRWTAGIIVIPLTAFLIYTFASARSISLDSADSIVVADFDNRTDEHFLDHSLTEAVRVSLRQSSQFIVLSRERVRTALELLQMKEKTAVDESTGLAVARREGARAVVAGNVHRIGSMYVLSCNIIDASTGETVALLRQDAPTTEACLDGIDRLCEDLRKTLGESMAQISKARERLQDVTTSSLQALELYSQAVSFESQGKYREAAIANEQAIAIDSQFVQAISDLAYEYRKLGEDSLAVVYHNRVLPLIHRVTDRERLENLAVYYGPAFESDIPKALKFAEELTVRYPNDAYAFATLGHLAMSMGDAKTSLEANQKAVAMYPEYAKTCYNNSAYALALNGRDEEALAWFRKAKELRPDYASIDTYMALVHWMQGKFDSAEAMLHLPVSGSDFSQRIQRSVALGSLYYFQGKLGAARDVIKAAIADCRQFQRTADEAYFHYLLGEVLAAQGDMNGYRKEMAGGATRAASPWFDLLFIGRSYVRHGMKREAEDMLARLSATRSFDPVFVKRHASFIALLSGELALASGQDEKALRCFEAVERFRAGDPVYMFAREGATACREQRTDTAMPPAFQDLLPSRGETIMGYLSTIRQSGPWTRELWPEAYLKRAEEYAGLHQKESAVRCLDSALDCWRAADASDLFASKARMLRARWEAGQ